MKPAALGTTALRSLAAVRLVNGVLGLLAPGVLVARTSADPHSSAPYYAFRMFGIRTIVLGADLLLVSGDAQRRARDEAVLIHATDTVCAVVGGIRGDLPRPAARTTVAISALNTALALVARRYAPAPSGPSVGGPSARVTARQGTGGPGLPGGRSTHLLEE
jgi:hypothetical protein